MTPGSLSTTERSLLHELQHLKEEAGSHSPSRSTIQDRLPALDVKIDACFLSNPYATDLFIERLKTDLLETGELRDVLEFYPSQNQHVAAGLATTVGVDGSQIFVCNGAIEAIQAALHRFAGRRVGVVLPTFSPYYEYLKPDQEHVFFRLASDDDFAFDPAEFVKFVRAQDVDTVCLINPNNPNGGYVPAETMRTLLDEFRDLDLVIVDESFVDFAYEDERRDRQSLAQDVAAIDNAILVKSMSKDFGVAGVRAGYAIMSSHRVKALLENGFLWNIGGLAEFFFRLFTEDVFQREYASARLKYLDEAVPFFEALDGLTGVQAFTSRANFKLLRLDPAVSIDSLVPLLLIRHGVYVRDCRDKVGLDDGEYIRVAARKQSENDQILDALRDTVPECSTG